jgi:hypothetical protein
VDFIKWAAAHTGLSKEFIHNECFTFLSFPGYTPSYSFCGSRYEVLQSQAERRGVSRFTFNTEANRMGLQPWTACVKRMERDSPPSAEPLRSASSHNTEKARLNFFHTFTPAARRRRSRFGFGFRTSNAHWPSCRPGAFYCAELKPAIESEPQSSSIIPWRLA